MLLNIGGKGTYSQLLDWWEETGGKKKIKGIFYEHLAPGRGTSHLLMSAAFSCPNLPKKNKGKAWQQIHREKWQTKCLMSMKQTDWSQNTPDS